MTWRLVIYHQNELIGVSLGYFSQEKIHRNCLVRRLVRSITVRRTSGLGM